MHLTKEIADLVAEAEAFEREAEAEGKQAAWADLPDPPAFGRGHDLRNAAYAHGYEQLRNTAGHAREQIQNAADTQFSSLEWRTERVDRYPAPEHGDDYEWIQPERGMGYYAWRGTRR
jgi:hypothetical protein